LIIEGAKEKVLELILPLKYPYIKNFGFVEQKNVIEHLKSIIDNFNPNELPIKSRDSFISVSMELGEIKKDCHDDAEGCLFVIPWVHFFSCRIILEYYNIENKLDINHSIKFDDNGKICEIILH
jgi:hypothetical protein